MPEQQPIPVGTTPASNNAPVDDKTIQTRLVQQTVQYGSRTGSPALYAQTQSVADPNQKLVGYSTGFQDTGRLCIGWIMDGTAIANAYRVHLEKGSSPIVAAAVSHTSAACFGATEINSYAPGTCVIVMVHDKHSKGFILGAVPEVLDTGRRAVHPYITQASRKRVDDCHMKYIKQPMGGQIIDWSGWRPFDGTMASEWGAITTTGLAVTLDDFMVQMSVNEFCGVYGFYHDSLLRVAGYQFQLWTAGHERDAFMDQAEYNDVQGYNAYPWEAVGLLTPGQPLIQEYMPQDYQDPQGKPYYAHWENKHTYQQPYHRSQWFYGYLGQGGRNVLHAPPQGVNIWTYQAGDGGGPGPVYDSPLNTQLGSKPTGGGGGDKDANTMQLKPCQGFHEDNIAMDGRRFIASAKSIVLSKRMLLPMPTRLRRPEDVKGDDAEKNYKAASYAGSGPDHDITGDLETGSEHPHLQRAAAVLDLHGYLFNYSGFHPFHWHTKDFKTWQQSELKYAKYNQIIPTFSTLQSEMYLPQAQPKELYVDHRYKTQKFYETESSISLLEDGSVVITDGYGAEIRMSAGCLTLSAPGDVWIKSGRSSQIWSGADCIVRAVDDVDISTTEKSIRIKSEQNLFMLAGNDSSQKQGGVLIESRAKSSNYNFDKCGDDVEFGGIVLRAPKSEVVTLANNIYLRSGGGGSKIKPGNITIDAGKGAGDLVTKSKNLFNFVGQGGQILQFFRNGTDDAVKLANMFSQSMTLLCGEVYCAANIIAGANALLKGSVLCADRNSHIFTGMAAKGLMFVAPCDADCADAALPALDTLKQFQKTILPELGDTLEKTALQALWYGDGRPGNAKIMDTMEFSFRTDEQYKVPDFLLFEDRWQQLARLYGSVPKKWTEKKVTNSTCGETWPFPGKRWLEEEDAFAKLDLNIVVKAGEGIRDKDRGNQGTLSEEYRQPKFKDIEKQKINGLYPIVGRN